jgi:hypothetical protein
MTHRTFGSLVLLALAACSDDVPSGPASSVPRVGRYAYVGSHAASSAFPARTYTGTMTVTAAARDEVFVTWQVSGFHPAPERGTWNGDAYRVLGDLEFGDIVHQIGRSGEGLNCTGVILWRRADDSLESAPVTCSMIFQGP